MAFQETPTEIEATLNQNFPGEWRRLSAAEMQSSPLPLFKVGWRVDLDPGTVQAPEVDHLMLVIDASFPNSQSRVLAPNLGSSHLWPHVEVSGLLCLPPTSIGASAADRITVNLHDALELLNLAQDARAAEFEREFSAYWSLQSRGPSERPSVLSLVKPGGISRQVMFVFDNRHSRILVADTKEEAISWFRNVGAQISSQSFSPGWLTRLPRPWHPSEFPKTVGDVIRDLPERAVRATLLPNRKSLFLFEATTITGPVFAAVLANGAKNNRLKNGFRSWDRVPVERIKRVMAQKKIERAVVSRVDASWVHGRDHSRELAGLRSRKVVIVGCGAIGSEVAELLAKAGVGELTLIDHDSLYTANVGRHLLGIRHIGWYKAEGVANALQHHLPHLAIGGIYTKKFGRLTAVELKKLAAMDMIVTAGLDIEGEAVVNAWRQTLEQPPAYLSTWVEAYGTAGHAVLLYGKADLMAGFEGEHPAFRLTDWPAGAGQLIVEAGCGNVFQPHGAVDLQPTIAMAAKLALDALLGRVPDSCRRVWFGDRDVVKTLGGAAREAFTDSNAIRQFPW